jgi:hypothetical protein
MADHPLDDRRRAHEEDYFQKKDRELIERLRQQARTEQQQRELGDKLGVRDPDVIRQLAELGFTPETVKLLPLLPVIEMAWAEGGVTAPERKLVTELARGRGVDPGSEADRQLAEWLDRRPAGNVFRQAARLIDAVMSAGGQIDASREDLLKYCEAIADASGGIFGIGRVSAEERTTLARLAGELQARKG